MTISKVREQYWVVARHQVTKEILVAKPFEDRQKAEKYLIELQNAAELQSGRIGQVDAAIEALSMSEQPR